MADESHIGFGAKLTVNDGASNAQAEFSNVLTFMIPKREFGEYETTLLNQLVSAAHSKDRTFNPTLRDNGLVQVEGFFTKAEYIRMVALHGVKGKTFVLTSPDADGAAAIVAMVCTFDGWVKELGEVKFEFDKPVMASFGIRVSGPITISAAANES